MDENTCGCPEVLHNRLQIRFLRRLRLPLQLLQLILHRQLHLRKKLLRFSQSAALL